MAIYGDKVDDVGDKVDDQVKIDDQKDDQKRQQLIDKIKVVFADYFALYPNRSEEQCAQQANEMLSFVLDVYQKNYFNLSETLEVIVKDFDKNKLMKEMITNVIQEIISPNKKLIYQTTTPSPIEEEEIKAEEEKAKDPEKPEEKPEEKKEEKPEDLEKKRRLHYQEMIKPVGEKLGGKKAGEEFVLQIIPNYKKNGFDKKKTVEEYLEPYPADVKTQLRYMIEKLLEAIDKYLCYFAVEKPPKPPTPPPPTTPSPKKDADSKADEKSLKETAKSILAEMVNETIKVVGEKYAECARNYVIGLIQLYQTLKFQKYSVIRSVEKRFKEQSVFSKDTEKKLIDLTNLLMEQIDYYHFLNQTEKKEDDNQKEDDGFISDDEEDKPVIRNQDYWIKYPIKAVFWEPNVTRKNQEREKIRRGARGKTVKPPAGYERDVTIFTRRWKGKNAKYSPPQTNLTKIVDGFKKQLDRLNYQAGITGWTPAENLRKMSKRMNQANQEYVPIAMDLHTLIRNLLKIEDMLPKFMDQINVPAELKFDSSLNLTSYEEFSARIEKIHEYLDHYEKSLAEQKEDDDSDDGMKEYEAWQNLDQLFEIVKRFGNGYLLRHPTGGKDKPPTDYMFLMAPYNYCFGCKIFRMETELTQDTFYDPLKCCKCDQEIYHLNNSLHFKFDPKKKMIPVLTRSKTDTPPVGDGPTRSDRDSSWVVDIDVVLKGILDYLDEFPDHVFPDDVKLNDFYFVHPSKEEVNDGSSSDDSSDSSSSSSSSGSYDQVFPASQQAIVTSVDSAESDDTDFYQERRLPPAKGSREEYRHDPQPGSLFPGQYSYMNQGMGL